MKPFLSPVTYVGGFIYMNDGGIEILSVQDIELILEARQALLLTAHTVSCLPVLSYPGCTGRSKRRGGDILSVKTNHVVFEQISMR
jgi:hypothetical protein